MILKSMAVGPIQANCYIVACPETQKAAVIDPGGDGDRILAAIDEDGLTVIHILNTHGHFDHVAANREIKQATGAPVSIHEADAVMLTHMSASAAAFGLRLEDAPPPDSHLNHGDQIRVGTLALDVIHTPGHSPGGVSFLSGDHLFVGDTLFSGSIGRTDLPGGSFDILAASIREKIYPLGDHITVHTGHGPDTTIGRERTTNPFVTG